MNWHAAITKFGRKQLERIPKSDKEKIMSVIGEMEQDPFGGDIAKLDAKRSRWRRRVGNYRIIYKLFYEERVVYIYDIRRRTSSTY